MCNITIQCLYYELITASLVNIHHLIVIIFFLVIIQYSFSKLQICSIVLLTMLCIISPWLIYFISVYLWKCVSFDPFHPPCPDNHQSVLCIYELVVSFVFSLMGFCCVCACLDSTYKWDNTVFVISVCLLSLSIMPPRSIHVFKKGKVSPFYGWWSFHCLGR